MISYNQKLANLMADEYLKLADRSMKLISDQKDLEQTSSICIALTYFAFAIETYLKSILFSISGKSERGHDLTKLWDKLDVLPKTWISENFDHFFDSDNETWNTLMIPGLIEPGKEISLQYKTQKNTAKGMITEHKLAFITARYGYERPGINQIKKITYNLNGLRILSWLLREIAISTEQDFDKAIKKLKAKKKQDKLIVKGTLPKKIRPFPTL